jgi:hypothetical protein
VSERPALSTAQALGLMLLAAFLWGLSFPIIKAMRRPAHQEKTLQRLGKWREIFPGFDEDIRFVHRGRSTLCFK